MTADLPGAEPAAPDLSVCDREPIHTPGHIQPHGVLLVTAPGTRRISHVSANAEAIFARRIEEILNTEMEQLLGAAAAAALEAAASACSHVPAHALPLQGQRQALVHRHQQRLFIELEPAAEANVADASLASLSAVITSLRHAGTQEQLCAEAAAAVRRLTGYDRVLVYLFDVAGHGSVVAEAKAAGLEAYLGLRYPASDIPAQARRLYVLQRVRAIPDMLYTPVALRAAEPDGPALDMTLCALRGVSPVHLEYMRNMGVRASLAISLLQEEALLGMIVCHHGLPIAPAPALRSVCDVIGQMVSMLLARVAETQALADRVARRGIITELRQAIDTAGDLMEGLRCQPALLLDLMAAGGALIRRGAATALIGRTPPEAAASAMVQRLLCCNGEAITGVADAAVPGGIAGDHAETASGILLLPLGDHPGDVLAWFRPAVAQTVRWGGDPRKAVMQATDTQAPGGQRVSPRQSFAAWTQELHGCALPWRAADLQAAEDFRRAVTQALLRLAEARLAQLSAIDALTGLANRRTLEAALQDWRARASPAQAALLFIDLDRFKTINDTLGHAAGDELLVQLAARLRQLAPAGSLAGRLGGDEFVLFLQGSSREAAEALAAVLAVELARPYRLGEAECHASASIGVAWHGTAAPDDILQQADAAMYAAKRLGGGRFALSV